MSKVNCYNIIVIALVVPMITIGNVTIGIYITKVTNPSNFRV